MTENSVQRRLAAILAADVAGYSQLMGQDEAGTLAAVRKLRAEVIELKVAEHQGRLFKSMGDGFLVEFPSVVNAVACAAAIQKAMAARNADQSEDRRLQLRIGVHLGDVISEGGDVYGDGVNVAARIEGLALPGGVTISAMVHENIGSRLDLSFEDMGEQQLKNIARPIKVYRLVTASHTAAGISHPELTKPSIAVLAFENLSGDREQEYFADGVVEEIITALSRMNWLFVIARNSSFVYKGRAVDVKQVGRELGARYVLEGSLRKAGGKLRITGQLINATTGAHLWADRYDGSLEDIFDLQDRVTASVVGAISPKLEQAEIERVSYKSTSNLDAYDYYLRGMAEFYKWTKETNTAALQSFKRAIELDPNYAAAYGMASRCFSQRKAIQIVGLVAEDIAEAGRLARCAADLGRTDDVALSLAGLTLGFVVGDVRGGMALNERALVLNPNLAWAWYGGSWMNTWLGQFNAAIEYAGRAMQLSPQDPMMFQLQSAMACAHFSAGRYDEALSWAEKALHDKHSHVPALIVTAASSVLLGRHAEAQKTMEHILRLVPALSVHKFVILQPYQRAEDIAIWSLAMRQAGLPEE